MPEEQAGTIDSAIKVLERYIEDNQRAGRKIITYLVAFSFFLLLLIIVPYLFAIGLPVLFALPKSLLSLPESLLYALAGLFVVVFGVLMAVYRFHLNEVARAAHYKIGFMRIRVAASNHDKEGFHSEVRQSLTDKAFDFSPSSVIGGKGKQVESPLPGHPSSDLSAMLLNKLLEGVEVKKKQ